jgi:hypothetical protein
MIVSADKVVEANLSGSKKKLRIFLFLFNTVLFLTRLCYQTAMQSDNAANSRVGHSNPWIEPKQHIVLFRRLKWKNFTVPVFKVFRMKISVSLVQVVSINQLHCCPL